MSPMISVIIPAYNCEGYLRESVESALKQTHSNLEVLVLDDRSTDGTLHLARKLAREDDRVQVFSNPHNIGTANTRNRGLSLAEGDYLAFLDGDDVWLPDKLEKQLTRMQQTECGFCYTSYSFIDAAGQPLGRPYLAPAGTSYDSMLKENVIGCSTVLLHRERLGQLRFDSQFFHEDYALWLSLLRGGKTACGLPEVLTLYRAGGRSSNKLKAARNRWQVYRKGESLSLIASANYLRHYCFAALKKHRK